MKKYWEKLGISQDVLSKRADVALHTNSKIEAGATPDQRIETVKKIDDALSVKVDDLIQEALQEGAYGVIYKPMDINKMVGIIEEVTKEKNMK